MAAVQQCVSEGEEEEGKKPTVTGHIYSTQCMLIQTLSKVCQHPSEDSTKYSVYVCVCVFCCVRLQERKSAYVCMSLGACLCL